MSRVIEILLDRTDVINMIRGTSPPYEAMNLLEYMALGSYSGGFNDSWSWNSSFPKEITLENLYFIYTKIKGEE